MDLLAVPRRLVVWIKSKPDPEVLGELRGLLAREGVLDDQVAVFQEEFGFFLCIRRMYVRPPPYGPARVERCGV